MRARKDNIGKRKGVSGVNIATEDRQLTELRQYPSAQTERAAPHPVESQTGEKLRASGAH
jgi:hypothetical protein